MTSSHLGRCRCRARKGIVALLVTLGFASVASVADGIPAMRSGGDLHGHVTVGRELVERRVRFNLYPDLRRDAPPIPSYSAAAELANVVIYFKSVDAELREGIVHEMRQERSRFVPHVLPVVQGDQVEFPNMDPVFHNVFSLSKVSRFDLGRYPRGRSRSVLFEHPGVVKVFCDIHSDMSAVILVLDNPFYATPGADGEFRIPDVPPGRYELVAWHERIRPATTTVTIEEGKRTRMEIVIPLGASGSSVE